MWRTRRIRTGRLTGRFRRRRQLLPRAPKGKDKAFSALRSSHRKKSRNIVRAPKRVPPGDTVREEQPARERAFLVGLDVRSRRGKGTVPAQATAAREAAAIQAASSENSSS